MAQMMQVIASNGSDFAADDVIEKMMDEKIVDILLTELTSLEKYKDNITIDSGVVSKK